VFENPASYTFDEIGREPMRAEEETFSVSSDVKRDLDFPGSLPGFLKAGFVYRQRDYEHDKTEHQYEPRDEVLFSQYDLSTCPGDVLGYPLCPTIDPVTGPAFDRDNPDLMEFIPKGSTEGSLEDDFEVDEDVLAGYLMGNVDIDKWTFTGGLRIENTDTTSKVLEVLADSPEINEDESNVDKIVRKASESNNYTELFPSLTIRWRATDRLTLRGSGSRTMARPRLEDLAASEVVDLDKDRMIDLDGDGIAESYRKGAIDRGNPDLDPRTSSNFDLGAEYYLDNGGILAIAGYVKFIEDPIFAEYFTEKNVIVQDHFVEDLEVQTKKNATEALLYGIEFKANSPVDHAARSLEESGNKSKSYSV
jgi:TonB-dependent receptor